MNKYLSKISGVTAALAAAGLAVTPVCAAGTTYEPVNGTSTTFDTTIYMRDTAKVPNVTFHYGVTAGAKQGASDGNLAVLAGGDGITSTGMPTITDIAFTADNDKAADGADRALIKKTGTVDFSGVTYKEPGVYRYVVTETGEAQGVTHEDKAHKQEVRAKALDVYVTDDGHGNLVVSGYVMHDNVNAKAEQLGETKKLADKDTNFEHLLTTSDVTLSKKVTGNQGSRDEYFKFTVNITGADNGTQYIVDLSHADPTTTNGVNRETHVNPALLTAGEDGTLSQDFWIQNGQSIKIQGLGGSTGYTVTEAENAYKTNIAVTGDTKNGEADIAAVNGKAVTDAAVTADTTVAYTNDKSGAVPTGLIMSIGGPAAIALLGGAGIVTICAKKKDEDAE